jgi:hypothetical protein
VEATSPELPQGFNWRYFQAAPGDQQLDYLRGDEWLVLDGMDPEQRRIHTRLPHVTARAESWMSGATGPGPRRGIELHADTLVIDVDRMACSLVWRGRLVLDSLAVAASLRMSGELVLARPSASRATTVDPDPNRSEEPPGDGDVLDRTAEVNLDALLSTALPFLLDAASTPPIASPGPLAQRHQPRAEDDDGLSTTLEVNPARQLAAAIPFASAADESGSASPAAPSAATDAATPEDTSASVGRDVAGNAPPLAPPAVPIEALTVERFAAIRALLDAGQPRESVLAAHGLDNVRWREEEEQILSDLDDAAEQADLAQLELYQQAYRTTWREVVGEEPVLPGLDPPSAKPADVSAMSGAPRVEPSAEAPGERDLAGSETLEVEMSTLRAALPFIEGGAPASQSSATTNSGPDAGSADRVGVRPDEGEPDAPHEGTR